MRLFMTGLLLYGSLGFAGELLHKVIPVTYANPDELLRALNPVLASGESMSVFNHNLIVNVSPETLTRIRSMLHQLDVPAPIFLISIHQDSDGWTPDEVEQSTTYSTSSPRTQVNNQSIQVEEGTYALISVGQDVPVLSEVSAGWITGVGYDRIKADNGFLVKPILQGDQVKIVIKRFKAGQDTMNMQNINTQNMQTTTIVDLDQWVKLAAIGDNAQNAASNTTTYRAGSDREYKTTLYIKVSRINS